MNVVGDNVQACRLLQAAVGVERWADEERPSSSAPCGDRATEVPQLTVERVKWLWNPDPVIEPD